MAIPWRPPSDWTQDSATGTQPEDDISAQVYLLIPRLTRLPWPVVADVRWREDIAMSRISTSLWFENEAETAARFYVSLIPGSTIEWLLYVDYKSRWQQTKPPAAGRTSTNSSGNWPRSSLRLGEPGTCRPRSTGGFSTACCRSRASSTRAHTYPCLDWTPAWIRALRNRLSAWKIGATGRIRTYDLCLRRAALYPAELRLRMR